VNVVMGPLGPQFRLADLSAIGVRRVSVGSALCRVALGAFLRGAQEMREHGTLTFASDGVSPREISQMTARRSSIAFDSLLFGSQVGGVRSAKSPPVKY
jgi:2-methylisocitrate lyase-like PEP mutase family enzyme